MSAFRIVIDRSLCSGFGSCLEEAPAVFELDGSGVATARVVESDDSGVLEAAASCPMGAISVYDALTSGRAA
jgi:ferredoxin